MLPTFTFTPDPAIDRDVTDVSFLIIRVPDLNRPGYHKARWYSIERVEGGLWSLPILAVDKPLP